MIFVGSEVERCVTNNLWTCAAGFLFANKKVERKKNVFSSHQSKRVLIDLHFASDTVNKKHHGPNPTLIELIGAGLKKKCGIIYQSPFIRPSQISVTVRSSRKKALLDIHGLLKAVVLSG